MNTNNKLIPAWMMALVGSFLFPLVSLAVVSSTTCDSPHTITTTSVVPSEHTTVAETIPSSETGLRNKTISHAWVLLGLSGNLNAPKSGSLYHYTSDGAANSILKQGIKPGRDGFSYLTNKGKLSPIQAQIELALPGNRQLPNALLKIDAGGLRKAGINPVFGPRRVQGNLPGLGSGGGTELLFDQAIPSQFIQRVY